MDSGWREISAPILPHGLSTGTGIVGTKVREASRRRASRTQRPRERHEQIATTPVRKNIGTKTIQMPKCGHECRDRDLLCPIKDRLNNFLALREIPIDVFDFHGSVVDQNATASAKPPSVMILMVSRSRSER